MRIPRTEREQPGPPRRARCYASALSSMTSHYSGEYRLRLYGAPRESRLAGSEHATWIAV